MLTFLLIGTAYSGQLQSNITAQSWLVADSNGAIIQSENIEEVRSIASISKLVTTMIVLDSHQDLGEQIGKYTRQELIQLALVKSDNKAAEDLCNNFPGGHVSCVNAMNNKVRNLGLTNTRFIEPTGLNIMNVSTARELVAIIKAAQEYAEIRLAAATSQGKIKVKKGWQTFNNTNPLVGKYNYIVSKTGYIRASGGCIAMMLDTELGRRIVVVLGSKNTHTRIPEADYIAHSN